MRLGLLRHYDFRQLFVADTISQLGTQVSILALPLVAVLALHAGPFEVGLLAACETAAFLLVGLPAGAWVDRMRRRNVLIVGDLGRAVVLGSVPVAWWLDVLTMPQLYAVGLLAGVFTVFFDVAYQSYLPHLVGRDNLVEGNAKLEAVRGVNQIAGPTAAGLVIQWLTAPVAVAVDAVSFVGSALFVGLIRKREPKPARKPDAHLGREIGEGLRFVLGNRLLRSIAMCTGSSNLFSNISGAMLIVLFARDLRLSPGTIGLFFSFGAMGGLAGALVATRVAARIGQGPAIWIPIAVAGPFQLLVPIAQRGWLLWAAAFGYLVYGVAVVVYNITQVSFRQGLTPERLLGRMNATMRFLVWGTVPIGGLIGGVLGKYLGVREALWVAAIGGMFTFLPVFLSPLRTMRELPTGHDEEPAPADVPVPQTSDT
ncbi:MAG: major facilitator transporter [Dactylosporangium sp.]|nr:major facilitator transporter [Dactylosporangium sp.]